MSLLWPCFRIISIFPTTLWAVWCKGQWSKVICWFIWLNKWVVQLKAISQSSQRKFLFFRYQEDYLMWNKWILRKMQMLNKNFLFMNYFKTFRLQRLLGYFFQSSNTPHEQWVQLSSPCAQWLFGEMDQIIMSMGNDVLLILNSLLKAKVFSNSNSLRWFDSHQEDGRKKILTISF